MQGMLHAGVLLVSHPELRQPGLGGPGGGALVSHLELKWCGPGVLQGSLCLYHFSEMAESIMSADQEGPGVHCARAVLALHGPV